MENNKPPNIHDLGPSPIYQNLRNPDLVTSTSIVGGSKRSKPNYIKATTISLIGIFLLVGGIVAGVNLTGKQQEVREQASEPTPIECPYSAKEGRIIVNFDNKELIANADKGRAQTGPFSAQIPPATYNITLVSYDNHIEKSESTELNETWHAILYGQNDIVVATTKPSGDIPETQDYYIGVTNVNFTIPSPVTAATAYHSAYPSNIRNSVVPVCVVFEIPGI